MLRNYGAIMKYYPFLTQVLSIKIEFHSFNQPPAKLYV